MEEERRGDTERRCGRVGKKPAKRLTPAPAISQDKVHRIDAIREIVREHGRRNHDAHRRRGLEAYPDRDTIEEAMRREGERPKEAAPDIRFAFPVRVVIFFVRMKKDKPIENEIAEKSEGDEECYGRSAVIRGAETNRLGQEIEERNTGNRTRREAKDEVELVAKAQCE